VLGLAWPEGDGAAIDAFLCEGDRHQRAGVSPLADQDRLERVVRDMYQTLLEIDDNPAQWAWLEPRLAEFEAVERFLAPHLDALLTHVHMHSDRAAEAERLLAAALVEGEAPLVSRQAGLASRAELRAELIAMREQARMLEARVASAESASAQTQAQLRAAESRTAEQTTRADQKEGEIQVLRGELAGSAQALVDVRVALAQAQQELRKAWAESSQRQQALTESERARQDILASHSWRITAPLRWIAEKFRGGAHG
jgi:chromosome segregation ATPase